MFHLGVNHQDPKEKLVDPLADLEHRHVDRSLVGNGAGFRNLLLGVGSSPVPDGLVELADADELKIWLLKLKS